MNPLRKLLNDYQASLRGLPDFRECCEIAAYIDDLQARYTELVTGEHHDQRDTIRDTFLRDCI